LIVRHVPAILWRGIGLGSNVKVFPQQLFFVYIQRFRVWWQRVTKMLFDGNEVRMS
jgi:hypothetical protein